MYRKELTFCGFIGLVILPAHRLVALFALNVPYDMPASGHIALHRFSLLDIHDRGEEESFAMLATEVPRNDVVEIGEVGFAILQRPSDQYKTI